MPPKPHRVLMGRVSSYAEEAAGFLRRRRMTRRPFARVYYGEGRSAAFASDTEAGRRLFIAAAELIDVARP
jgi:hypothetical protein